MRPLRKKCCVLIEFCLKSYLMSELKKDLTVHVCVIPLLTCPDTANSVDEAICYHLGWKSARCIPNELTVHVAAYSCALCCNACITHEIFSWAAPQNDLFICPLDLSLLHCCRAVVPFSPSNSSSDKILAADMYPFFSFASIRTLYGDCSFCVDTSIFASSTSRGS
ncbi:unnamed protein product [Albugo candida]|uniref:Uncharacterized protein n=1 Tax=Albugo candida TaxID=65357 RepID=A0A024G1Y8_9STRA|nr:unnamed protein product [Albugo candida]|eukprot:CCI40566.1 unnamed protein product [Albugo candida]